MLLKIEYCYLMLLVLLYVSCNYSNEKLENYEIKAEPEIRDSTKKAEIICNTPITFNVDFKFDTSLQNRTALLKVFPIVFSAKAYTLKFIQKGIIKDYGECELYQVDLIPMENKEEPMFTLLYNKERSEVVLLRIIKASFSKIVNNTSYFLIGGYNTFHGIGYYEIYEFDATKFKILFNTAQISLPAYSDGDCLRYKPAFLKLTVKDINNDACNDLIFSGRALKFCKGNADFIKPVENIKVNFTFLWNKYEGNWFSQTSPEEIGKILYSN